jgi:predicted nucleic acid-binding protein
VIVVDSSVWIDHFRDQDGQAVSILRSVEPLNILLGDLVLLELLQGARDDRHAGRMKRELIRYETGAMLGTDLAIEAAANYRHLRSRGATPRRTTDLIIATFCISRGHHLLHQDRDFELFQTHLGLQVVA